MLFTPFAMLRIKLELQNKQKYTINDQISAFRTLNFLDDFKKTIY